MKEKTNLEEAHKNEKITDSHSAEPYSRINYAYLVTITVNLLALTGDTTLTWSSPILPKLQSNDSNINPLGRPITPDEETWIGSLQYIGGMCGILPSAFLADKIGRKPVLLLLAIPHLVGFLCFAFATDIYWYFLGRFLGGFSFSSVLIVLPMYIAEISEDSYRGMLVFSFATVASFGDLVPYIMGPFISIYIFNLILAMFPIIFFVLFFFIAPESPYYYVNRDDTKATRVLNILRSGKHLYSAVHEIQEIKNEKNKDQPDDIFNTLKKKYVIKGFIVALGLSSFQALSGLGPILAYTQIIFETAGTNISSDLSAIIVGVVLFLASFGGPFLADRKGRKFLLICSCTGCIISEGVLGIYFLLQDNSQLPLDKISWLPIACIVGYVLAFNTGFGPVPYALMSEIFPNNVKFYLATITNFSGMLMTFFLTKFFAEFNDSLGRSGTFFLFSGFCAVGLLFIIIIVPETKGKSFQEIQEILDG